MKEKVYKKPLENWDKYTKEDLDIARKFAQYLNKELGDIMKGFILFGSVAREEAEPKSDIDVLIILDDASYILDNDFYLAYNALVGEGIKKISHKLHVHTMRITSFFEYTSKGDPVILNILRDGLILIDYSFIEPLQQMVKQGRIRPSPEAIYTYAEMAHNTLIQSEEHNLRAVLDLYWSAIDISHSLIMYYKKVPPSPSFVPKMLKEIKSPVLRKEDIKLVDELYKLMKKITKREIKRIDEKKLEELRKKTKDYVERVYKFLLG